MVGARSIAVCLATVLLAAPVWSQGLPPTRLTPRSAPNSPARASKPLFSASVAERFREIGYELAHAESLTEAQADQAIILLTAARSLNGRAAGVEPRDEWIATGRTEKHAGFSEESGYEAMQSLLRADADVTAVFASSDVQAIGAWQALRQADYDVPEDVALIGYDDIKISRFIGLSSVAQNMHDIGARATDLLLRRLRRTGPSEVFSELVTPELAVRASSAGTTVPAA